ncbi:MAG TPA: FAD-dependent oxidoreductase [Anaerolineae bacterium]|nr:FAD-dependent oxidoreductase [Anaerolineae bacterium]
MHFLILGAGIAGLTAGRELRRYGHQVTIVEKSSTVGGLARSYERDGYRFDLGGHRFHSHNPSVIRWLQELLGDDLLTVTRHSRILLNGRFIPYPLQFPQALAALPPHRALYALGSYLYAQYRHRHLPDDTFENWITKRFGPVMYNTFFRPYNQKVWGVNPKNIAAEWGAQRLTLPNLGQTIRQTIFPNATPKNNRPPTHFYYPRYGFGAIPQALATDIERHDGRIITRANAEKISFTPHEVAISFNTPDGPQTISADTLISTIPISALRQLLPQPNNPLPNLDLHYRGFISLNLILNQETVSPDLWTYFPDDDFIFGRTHEPKNWSPALVPDPQTTSLGLEIFANPDDHIWRQSNDQLAQTAIQQLTRLNWITPDAVQDHWAIRIPHAYPIYDLTYRQRLQAIKGYFDQWPRLHLLGRTGAFRYMDTDGVIESVFDFLAWQLPEAIRAINNDTNNGDL